MIDTASLFECHGESLVAVISQPESDPGHDVGVLVVVGGPQYRVGSHRQFVLLARALASDGIPCMRFDYRGMGDSTGPEATFDQVDDDLRQAVAHFLTRCPTVKRVVLWGLCDGASAIGIVAPHEPRVCATVLLNPWVRSEAGHAKTMLKHYYLKRLFSKAFWKKLFSAKVSIRASALDLVRKVQHSALPAPSTKGAKSLPWLDRMREGVVGASLPTLIMLSGRDYVANEFDELCSADIRWRQWRDGAVCHVERIDSADHTFSTAEHRALVASLTAKWIQDQVVGV